MHTDRCFQALGVQYGPPAHTDIGERVRHGNQQERPSGNAGSAAGAHRGHYAQQQSRDKAHFNPQRVGHTHGHDGNGNCTAVHVDGGSQGNAHRIEVFVQPQFFAKPHVDGNVGGRRAGEERLEAAFFQASPQQGIGVLPGGDEGPQWIEYQCIEQHAAHQQEHQGSIGGEHLHSALGNRRENKTHDTEWRELDHPFHYQRQNVGHSSISRLIGSAKPKHVDLAAIEDDRLQYLLSK